MTYDFDPKEYRDIMNIFTDHSPKTSNCSTKYQKNHVIIYPPTIDWDWMMQRPQQLMENFSLKGIKVFYCNKTQSKTSLYTAINPNLTIIHNNSYLINEVIPALKKENVKIILWVSWAKLEPFLDKYQPDFIIYDYLDDFPDWKKYHYQMVQKSDIVITTSRILQKQMIEQFPDKPSFLIPNGCNIDDFKPKNNIKKVIPPELKKHKGPIITYSGAWAPWVDQDLVHKIARKFRNALVLIIGVEFGTKVNKTIPNLKYIGYKQYKDLPSYLQNSTVCIIPFLIGQITNATNPIKMYEYLASGTPVVSTNIPEANNIPGVFIGYDHESFLRNIDLVLQKKLSFNKDEVYNWLASHTWDKRIDSIIEILNQTF